MNRVKSFDATGIAPNGVLYAGDLNAIQDAAAAQNDLTQTIGVNTIQIGETGLQLLHYGTGEARLTGAIRADGIIRSTGGGVLAGAFTTTARDAIAVGSRPPGMQIYNTTTGRLEWNSGSDAAPSWRSVASDSAGASANTGGYTVNPGTAVVYGYRYAPTAVTAGQVAFMSAVVGEGYGRFFIDPNGVMSWGIGTVPGDTTLYRNSANFLISGGNFWAGNTTTPSNASIAAIASGDGWPRVGLQNNSSIVFGPGTSGTDTNLYRLSAANLKTDGSFFAASSVVVDASSGGNRLYIGGLLDTFLYRQSAGRVESGGSLSAIGSILLDRGGTGAPLYFGASADANLYRGQAGALRTDSILQFVQSTAGNAVIGTVATGADAAYTFYINRDGSLHWGIGGSTIADTNLYRSAAAVLRTDGDFWTNTGAGGGFHAIKTGQSNEQIGIQVDGGGVGIPRIFFGPGSSGGDAWIERTASQTLHINGSAYGVFASFAPTAADNDTTISVGYRIAGVEKPSARVTLGAADSGGTGFRVMRVPN